ncbi:hypothetical protein H0W26_04335 [Candidatus Dependentiae bacterium]|nr:hypothetical protein [Candidatus Dependentiae bacterium]
MNLIKEITQKSTDESLDLSKRDIRTKLKRFINEGIPNLICKGRDQLIKQKLLSEDQNLALDLLQTEEKDSGLTFTRLC